MGYGDPSCHASNIKGTSRIRLLNIWKTAVIPTRFSAIDIIGELSLTLLSLNLERYWNDFLCSLASVMDSA
jgi:hypothetical protein